MAMCRSTLRNNAAGNLSPASVLHAVNRAIFPDIREDMFVSLLYLVLTRESGEIHIARAGPRAAPGVSKGERRGRNVRAPGMAAGIDDGEVFERSLVDSSINLESGDLLLLYTDGVIEATNGDEEEFGIDRLRNILADSAARGRKPSWMPFPKRWRRL